MFCSSCSASYPPGARVCDVCGGALTAALAGAPSGPQASAQISDVAVAKDSPKGLGGWLILVGLGLIAGLVSQPFLLLLNVHLLANGAVRFMNDPRSAGYVPGFVAILRFGLVANIAFLAFDILLAILFVRESRKFPRFFMIFLGAVLIYVVADRLMFAHAIAGSSPQMQQRFPHVLEDSLQRIMISAGGVILWLAYIVKSKRVKATFVH